MHDRCIIESVHRQLEFLLKWPGHYFACPFVSCVNIILWPKKCIITDETSMVSWCKCCHLLIMLLQLFISQIAHICVYISVENINWTCFPTKVHLYCELKETLLYTTRFMGVLLHTVHEMFLIKIVIFKFSLDKFISESFLSNLVFRWVASQIYHWDDLD